MADDLLERMQRNPRDWRIDDVIKVCGDTEVLCTPPRSGSHYKVKHPAVASFVIVPAHRPIKPVYIRALIRFIDAVLETKS